MASTIITAPSTTIPKSKAPRDIRLAETPNRFIREIANKRDNGITEATIRPALKFPRSRTRIKMTIKPPSNKLVNTVEVVLPISSDRSIKGINSIPSGSDFLIVINRSFILATTLLALLPFIIRTMPPATSPSPFLPIAPKRGA